MLLVAALLSMLSGAAPDEEPGAARVTRAVTSTAATRTATVAAKDPRNSPPWWLYDDAFVALAGDNWALAEKLLDRLIEGYPAHPAAAQARIVRLRLTGQPEHSAPGEDPFALPPDVELHQPLPPRPLDPISSNARAELILGQSIAQTTLATFMCASLECSEVPALIALVLGAGTGIASSAFFSRDGIRASHAAALNSGPIWGAVGAGLLFVTLEPDSGTRNKGTFGVAVAGGGMVGLAIAEGAWAAFQPSSGDLSLFNSAAGWSALIAGLVAGLATPDDDTPHVVTLLGGIGGGSAGIIAASALELGRAQVLAADTGGMLGLILGSGVQAAAGLDDSARLGVILTGTLIGLAAGATLSGVFVDGPELFPIDPIVSVGGDGATIGWAGRF